jgi:hypothetical protein
VSLAKRLVGVFDGMVVKGDTWKLAHAILLGCTI